jgi:hypothetical protein
MAKPKKIIKSKVKKIAVKKVKREGKLVGKVTHYFSDISVGVIKLSAPLNTGDEVRIVGGENTDFSQEVKSMQIDRKEVKKATKGKSIGLKIKEKVREGYKVFKV